MSFCSSVRSFLLPRLLFLLGAENKNKLSSSTSYVGRFFFTIFTKMSMYANKVRYSFTILINKSQIQSFPSIVYLTTPFYISCFIGEWGGVRTYIFYIYKILWRRMSSFPYTYTNEQKSNICIRRL